MGCEVGLRLLERVANSDPISHGSHLEKEIRGQRWAGCMLTGRQRVLSELETWRHKRLFHGTGNLTQLTQCLPSGLEASVCITSIL